MLNNLSQILLAIKGSAGGIDMLEFLTKNNEIPYDERGELSLDNLDIFLHRDYLTIYIHIPTENISTQPAMMVLLKIHNLFGIKV